VRIYTAHTSGNAAPLLVREGFSWGAFLFGPFWLLAQRAWIPGLLVLCADFAVLLTPAPVRGVLTLAAAWAAGLFGRDLVRWSLGRRGYDFVHVIAAPDDDAAMARLLARRPDLIMDALA
jgi:hypothetical protein